MDKWGYVRHRSEGPLQVERIALIVGEVWVQQRSHACRETKEHSSWGQKATGTICKATVSSRPPSDEVKRSGVGEGRFILYRCEGAAETATPSSTSGQCSSAEGAEAIRSRTRMAVVVHEECSTIRYECRVLVSFLAVFFMFTSTAFEGRFLSRHRCRAYNDWPARFGWWGGSFVGLGGLG